MQDISQFIMENDLLQYGIVSPSHLYNARKILIVVYNLKDVEITCDTHQFKLEAAITFLGFLGSLKMFFNPTIGIKYKLKQLKWLTKSKDKIKIMIKNQLQDHFMQFDIEVK